MRISFRPKLHGISNRPQPQPRSRSRLGFTLIESVAVIALFSVLFGVSGLIIRLLLRSDQSVSQQSVLELTLLKLSHQFRDDAHAATDVEVSADQPAANQELVLQLSGTSSKQVKYRVVEETLIRETTEGDQAAREVFRLPGCRIELLSESRGPDAEQRAQPGFLILRIARPGLAITPQQPRALGMRELTVLAELGRDRRVLSPLFPARKPREAAPNSGEESQP